MIRKYAEFFCWKNVSSFCTAKATHIFSAKNIRILYTESAKRVNKMILNELVKLTMLWTTGPWYFNVACKELKGHIAMIKVNHLPYPLLLRSWQIYNTFHFCDQNMSLNTEIKTRYTNHWKKKGVLCDEKLVIFFPEKRLWHFMQFAWNVKSCFQETICMKCQILFPGKMRKIFQYMYII